MKKKVKLLTYVLVVVTLGSLLIACSANKAVVKDQEEKANIVEKQALLQVLKIKRERRQRKKVKRKKNGRRK